MQFENLEIRSQKLKGPFRGARRSLKLRNLNNNQYDELKEELGIERLRFATVAFMDGSEDADAIVTNIRYHDDAQVPLTSVREHVRRVQEMADLRLIAQNTTPDMHRKGYFQDQKSSFQQGCQGWKIGWYERQIDNEPETVFGLASFDGRKVSLGPVDPSQRVITQEERSVKYTVSYRDSHFSIEGASAFVEEVGEIKRERGHSNPVDLTIRVREEAKGIPTTALYKSRIL